MLYSLRSEFTAFLRKTKTNYTTSPGYVHVGNFHFYFSRDLDTVTIRTPICPALDYVIPYSSPETVFRKYLDFKQLVKTFLAYQQSASFKGHITIGLS